jgi:hypothetical protein
VDAHVHLHPNFELSAFLAAAVANVRRGAAGLGLSAGTVGCLVLTDAGDSDGLARLRDLERGDREGGRSVSAAGSWTVHDTAEPGSVLVRHGGELRLVVGAGRQVATSEGLEVLALLTDAWFPGPLPLRATIGAVREAGAVPVIPWGFGKWTLRRGAQVAAALRADPGPLFLGDNGGRPGTLRTPPLLRRALRHGPPVLPGSDPLPFPDHQGRAGSFGFVADVALDLKAPAASLRQWLLTLGGQPPVYGEGRRVDRFVRDQVRMQLRRIRGAR